MAGFRTILCATDFSPPSVAALEYAKVLARGGESVVHLIYVLPVLPMAEGCELVAGQLEEQIRADSERSLDALLAAHRVRGVRMERHIGFGPAPAAIVHAAERLRCDLISLGTSGKTGVRRHLLGSVAERVMQTSSVNVLAVPAAVVDAGARGLGSILCAVDFSARSELALDSAISLARTHTAAVDVVHVWDKLADVWVDSELASTYVAGLTRDLEALVQRHATDGVSVTCHVRSGIPYVEIVAMAAERRADLIVSGATGKSRVEHFLLGSVAERVARSSPVPVLAVRSRADA